MVARTWKVCYTYQVPLRQAGSEKKEASTDVSLFIHKSKEDPPARTAAGLRAVKNHSKRKGTSIELVKVQPGTCALVFCPCYDIQPSSCHIR